MMRSDESFNGSSCERCCWKKSADFLDFCGFHSCERPERKKEAAEAWRVDQVASGPRLN